jgi:hypothetical protein
MPKDVDVKITAKKENGKIIFEMEEGNRYTEILVFNKTKDKISKNDFYVIKFTLDDQTGDGLEFDTGNPMYLSKGSDKHVPKCPQNGNIGNPQGFASAVDPTNSKILTVTNFDMDECFYKFALNFKDAQGNRRIFDPIYGNQDGGSSLASAAIVTATVSSAIAGAAVTLLTNAAAASTSVLTSAAIGAVIGFIAAFILEKVRQP